jgi:predicted ribosomally synthesized peptide with SipW-like signal peptide
VKGADISTLRKTLISFAIVGFAGAVAGSGAFSAFSQTTSSDNNVVTAGSVNITTDSPGTAAYSLPTAKPGDTAQRCFQVTYSGSLPSTVKFYRGALSGDGLESYVNLVIQKGTGTATNCSDFAAAANGGSAIYSGTLGAFSATSFAGGVSVLNRAGSASWTNAAPNNVVTFRIQATLDAATPSSMQTKTTGTHQFIWEAQNS